MCFRHSLSWKIYVSLYSANCCYLKIGREKRKSHCEAYPIARSSTLKWRSEEQERGPHRCLLAQITQCIQKAAVLCFQSPGFMGTLACARSDTNAVTGSWNGTSALLLFAHTCASVFSSSFFLLHSSSFSLLSAPVETPFECCVTCLLDVVGLRKSNTKQMNK